MPSTNPGRPVGARNKLQRAFLEDLAAEWEVSGKDALKLMAIENPTKFVQCCAALMPKEVALDVSGPLSAMSDDELQAALQSIRQLRADAISGVAIDETAPAMKVITDGRKIKN